MLNPLREQQRPMKDEGTSKKELRTGEGGHGEEKTTSAATPEEQKNSSVDSEETAEESRVHEGSTMKEYTTSPLAPAEHDDSFFREPFPCEQKGCKVFHGDQSTGLCPAHGGGGGGSSESRDEDEEQPGGCSSAIAVCIPPRSVLEHRFELSIEFGTIFLLTAGMAVLDTDNRTVIAGLFGSAFVMMCLNILGADPDAGRIVGFVFFILAAIVLAKKMVDTVVVLEGMEVCWKAYDDEYNAEIESARRKYGGEIPTDAYGPEPKLQKGLRQSELDFRQLYVLARRNFAPFRSIMERLSTRKADGTSRRFLGPAIKRIRRAKEKMNGKIQIT